MARCLLCVQRLNIVLIPVAGAKIYSDAKTEFIIGNTICKSVFYLM
jgi:hypothetical protein